MDFIRIKELSNDNNPVIPKKIFIVPYRDRIQHKFFLSKYMTFLLEDERKGNSGRDQDVPRQVFLRVDWSRERGAVGIRVVEAIGWF